MSKSRLLNVTIERFKSFKTETAIKLAPLTIFLGRNNSGKSSLIQSILLLKQTLADPRVEIPLQLEGVVSAFNLREITSDWPKESKNKPVQGPSFGVHWESQIELEAIVKKTRHPDLDNLVRWTGFEQLKTIFEGKPHQMLETKLEFDTSEQNGVISIDEIRLISPKLSKDPLFLVRFFKKKWRCYWKIENASKIAVELEHFLPYLKLNQRSAGIRHRQRTWFHAYLLLFEQPIEALKQLLSDFQYLSSTRLHQPSLYRASNIAPKEIGISGEFAAQLLHRRQNDIIHYLPALKVMAKTAIIPKKMRAQTLIEAVNAVLSDLSVEMKLSVEEIKEVGFRLFFGNASFSHVGQGLSYLLPLIELGLLADPLRFQNFDGDISVNEYQKRCPKVMHIAIEEPEAHLHPKIQSHLAHWMVSLAMSNRQLLVETHSDHLVRRLRGLLARARTGSELEKWLLENVLILEIEQNKEGHSSIKTNQLTMNEKSSQWPKNFMDEASNEDTAIYYLKLNKKMEETSLNAQLSFIKGKK